MKIEEIDAIVKEELQTASKKLQEEQEKIAKAKEAESKRDITLADARAHLISALGLYNEVFKITEFTNENAEDLAEALKEVENFIIQHPDFIKICMNKAAKPNYKSSILNGLSDGFWSTIGF